MTLHLPPSPNLVATGDFNNDAKPDIAVRGAPLVSVLLGNGNGTFQQQIDTDLGIANDQCQATGDLNRDGKLDLLVSDGGALTTWLGNGDGTFAHGPTSTLPLTSCSHALVADFNEDGTLDVVVDDSRSVALMLGAGDGSFGAGTSLGGLGRPNIWDLVTGDVDGDGHVDLISAAYASGSGSSASDALIVQFGDGKGGFTSASVDTTVARTLVVHDFDGDGKADVVMQDGSELYVWISQGRTFKPVVTIGTPPFSLGVGAAVAADFNGDGRIDYILSSYPSVWVMLGDGAGGFAAPVQHAKSSGPLGHIIAAADFNGDGADDVVSLLAGSLAISSKAGDYEIPSAAFVADDLYSLASGDFNEDGRPDLISYGYYTGTLASTLQQPDGTFSRLRVVAAAANPTEYPGLLVADFDHDQHLDALMPGALLLGNGDGTFHPGAPPPADVPLALGDFNEDGWPDVVFGSQLALSDQTGPFKTSTKFPVTEFSPLVADFNHDGHDDLALINSTPRPFSNAYTVVVLIGAGDGSLEQTFSGIAGGLLVAAADLNCDGKLDLITESGPLLGNGDGTFVAALGWTFFPQTTGDFNHDGIVDVAGNHRNSIQGILETAMGKGDGTLATPTTLAPLWHPQTVSAIDLDGNGRSDLVAHGQGTLQVFINSCTR